MTFVKAEKKNCLKAVGMDSFDEFPAACSY
jgi:hypothetical protein